MDVLVLVGRILFTIVFLGSALNHLTQSKQMAAYAGSRGIPAAMAAPVTLFTGLLLLAGGLSVLLGIWADLGALLLAVFLLSTALVMHAFWKEEGDAKMMEMQHFMKDLALAGAALMLLAFFSYTGDELGLTITGPLFDIT